MSLWVNPSANDNMPFEIEPTWFAQYPTEGSGIESPESYETNLQLAKTHFDWLMDPNNYEPDGRSKNGFLIVAVMFDPSSRWHFASTVPMGRRKSVMRSVGRTVAPRWYSEAIRGKSSNTRLLFHAEDGVYFNYESSDKAQMNSDPQQKPYPRGSVIATYGFQKDVTTNEIIQPPKRMPSCSSSLNKNPSCQKIASGLGVSFSEIVPGDPPVDPEEIGVEDSDEGITDEQLTEFLAIRGRTNPFMKRNDSTSSIPVHGSTPVLTFSYTGSWEKLSFTRSYPVVSTPQSSVPVLGTPSNSTSTISTSYSPSPTPKPSCWQQLEDPDRGINQEYCVCDGSRTLPLLTISPLTNIEKSCEYTSLPPKDTKRAIAPPLTEWQPTATPNPGTSLEGRDLTISNGFGPPTTDSKACEVCTPVAEYEATCTSLEGCIIPTGAVTLEAGSSSVHVGTVTGTALYTSISSALDKICPTPTGVTGCSTDSVTIGGIPYVDADVLNNHGELVVRVGSSSYNDSSIRDALIKTAATAAQMAAQGKNCYEQEYSVLELKRSESPWWVPRLFRRDRPFSTTETATWCNTVGFAGPQYYNPWWRLQETPGATDYIDAEWEFHVPPGGDFLCDLLQGFADAFAVIQPEFAVGDIGLGEGIDIICKDGED
ncbi:hypothetical protein F4801DRAFT_594890 [Xylaria longipes]|nr:hypothetical protein F4801DRAFT_594890 [Xylaria longipes]